MANITSTRNVKMFLGKQAAAPEDLGGTVTITVGKDPTVTFDSTAMTNPIENGDLIEVKGTDQTALDSKVFIVDSIDVTTPATSTLVLKGAETTVATLNVAGTFSHYQMTDLQALCLSGVEISAGSANTIDISTFCIPGASLAGNPTAGTLTFTGFTDITDLGYAELLSAEQHAENRLFYIQIPFQGSLVGVVSIGSVSWALPLEGSSSYSFAASMAVPLRHIY